MNKRNVFSLNLFVVELPSWTRSFIDDLVDQLLLRLCQDLHIVFGDIAHLGDIQWEYDFFVNSSLRNHVQSCHLHDPPGQDHKVIDRPGWKKISVTSSEHRGRERPKFCFCPRLVHQLDVLVSPDPQKSEAVNSSEVWEGVIAALLLHDRLQHHDVVLEGGDPEALDHHVREVVREKHQVPPTVVDQLLVIPLLVLLDVPHQVATIPEHHVH